MNREEIQFDILSEFFNISVGRAAEALSEIVGKRIFLQIPHISVLDTAEKRGECDSELTGIWKGTLMVSSLSFGERLSGVVNMIFPADKIRLFVQLCAGEDFTPMGEDEDFTDVDFDVIREIGNIVLNSIIGGLGNLLEIELSYELPVVKVYDRIDFHRDIESKKYQSVLILSINFIVENTEIECTIVLELTFESFELIKQIVDKLEAELT